MTDNLIKIRGFFKNRAVILILCAVVGYFAAKAPARITISASGSVKRTVFWSLAPEPGKLTKGRYLRANHKLDLPTFKCDLCSIVKKAGCVPGQKLEEREGRFYCDGEYICEALKREGLQWFHFSGTIPEGQYFLIGEVPESYDSRYFGFVSIEQIDAILIPLI